MEKSALEDWFDRHHVEIIRTFATTLDGMAIGKYVHRNKFAKTLPEGHAISDMGAAQDIAGQPHMTFWNNDRANVFGDIIMRPDLSTLISDGTDAALGHCFCDMTNTDGDPLAICSRSTLKRLVDELAALGYSMKATFELEFFLFAESYAEIERKKFRLMKPVTATPQPNIYMLRNAYHATGFMTEVMKRMAWKGISYEGWSDEAAVGQFELNLVPTDPLMAADNVMRTKQILYEVAVDMGYAVTFMAKPSEAYGSGMHVHHSLQRDEEAVFFDDSREGNRTALVEHWLAGILATLPAAVSFLCPSVNAYRRLAEFSGAPNVATWGIENKSAALRLITTTAGASRIEHRVGSADLNPYLALAVIMAGGIAGLRESLELPPPHNTLAWGLPDDIERLPDTISKATAKLTADERLTNVLGRDLVDYWVRTRELEWLAFHTEGGDADAKAPTPWEFKRYFALT